MNTFSRRIVGVFLASLLMACVAQADVSAAWNQDSDGNWSNGGNWSGGSAPAGTTGVATFNHAITADRTITVDSSPWTINKLSFGSGIHNWTVAGGTLNLEGDEPSIAVAGNATVASVLSGSSGLVKTESGTLILAGTNTYSGDTTIADGTLQIGDGNGISATAGNGSLSIGAAILKLNFNEATTLANSSVTGSKELHRLIIQNIGDGKVTINNGSVGGVIDGGEGGIVLANLITTDFAVEGDLTFGSDKRDYTVRVLNPGATLRIVNQGTFWWIGSELKTGAPNLDIAAGVTVSLSPYQAAKDLFYKNLSGDGNLPLTGLPANAASFSAPAR